VSYLDKLKRLEQTKPTSVVSTPACSNCGAGMTPITDISGKPYFECPTCAVGDGTDRPNGVFGDGASVVDQIVENSEIVAVLICSKILEAHIWLAFDDDFDPKDGQAVFYAHELEFLKTKTREQLRKIHALKVGASGLGTKVRQ
jgi:hypothetical protein